MTERTYTVRSLKWERQRYDDPVTYTATMPFMDYVAEKYSESWHGDPFEDGKSWCLTYHGENEMDHGKIGEFYTLVEAKAAAQVHYVELISRALIETALREVTT